MTPLRTNPDAALPLPFLIDVVAELIERPASELRAEEDIIEQGLDSVRLMVLVERLREQGADVDFLDLAESTTLLEWAELLEERGFVEPTSPHERGRASQPSCA